MKVTLSDFEPKVWRRVLVPDSIALPKLHRVIQHLMLWWDYHTHLFTVDGVHFGQPETDDLDDVEWRNEGGVKLTKHLQVGASIDYRYDFGDDWRLSIELEQTWPVLVVLKHAVCVEGQHAAPPEDVGGTRGFRRFLDALADPSDDEHHNYVEWSGGKYNFHQVDLAEINARLQQVR